MTELEKLMIDLDKLREVLVQPEREYFSKSTGNSERVKFDFAFPQHYWEDFEELCKLYDATLVYDPTITGYWCYRTENRTIRVPLMDGILSSYEFAKFAPHELAHAVQYVVYANAGGVVEEHYHSSEEYQIEFERVASEFAYEIYKLYFSRFWADTFTKETFTVKESL